MKAHKPNKQNKLLVHQSKKQNSATMAFHLSAQSPSVFPACEHATLSHDNSSELERWWEGRAARCAIFQVGVARIPVMWKTICWALIWSVSSPIYIPLHQQSRVCQPSPSHSPPVALAHSNTNEKATFDSLGSLTLVARFCYHFISIYWMEEKIAQFQMRDVIRGVERKERERSTEVPVKWFACFTFAFFIAVSTFSTFMF